MSSATLANGTALLGLERKRVLEIALVIAGIWSVAYQQSGVLPWHALYTPANETDVQAARLFALWSAGAIWLALGSHQLSAALERLHQRVRSEADDRDGADNEAFGAVMRGASDPMVILYADTLQLADASDSFYRRMLLARNATAGRSLFNLLRFANRERMQAMLERDSGVIPFQQVEIGPEPVVANLRFFHSEHEGTRYLHLAFEEVTDLYYVQLAFDAIDDPLLIVSDEGGLFYANRAANALLGELYVGKPMLNLLRSHRLIPAAGLAAAHEIERLSIGQDLFHQSVLEPRMGAQGESCRLFWLHRKPTDP